MAPLYDLPGCLGIRDLPGRFPSDVILMSATSAGVPTKAPVAPAVIPSPALVRKLGGLPSGLENFSNRYV